MYFFFNNINLKKDKTKYSKKKIKTNMTTSKKENEIYIKVTENGPYILYGISEINQELIIEQDNIPIKYKKERSFAIKEEVPYKAYLCRCGHSKNPPFCDGAHIKQNFQGIETASFDKFKTNAIVYKGKNLILLDNPKFCCLARFCDYKDTIWNLIHKGDKESDELAIKESQLCPSGRLIILNKNGLKIENNLLSSLSKSVSVIQDPGLKVSGPIWLKGGIRVESVNGKSYEIRLKQTLCRCGKSKNKPFCDCAHFHFKFQDNNFSF